MKILEGLLTINGSDPYLDFGAFLAEEEAGGHANFDALLKGPKLKEQRTVSYRDRDGVRLPAKLVQRWEARTVALRFAIVAPDAATFERQYYGFLDFLRQGEDGYLMLHLKELSRTWRFYLTECSDYSQLTAFDSEVVGTFTATFCEPVPDFSAPVRTNPENRSDNG